MVILIFNYYYSEMFNRVIRHNIEYQVTIVNYKELAEYE